MLATFASLVSIGAVHAQSLPVGDDFGRGLLGGVDVDRDGVCDVLVLEGGWDEPELVWVLSGRTGSVIRKDVGEPRTRLLDPHARCSDLARIGDVDGDGTLDYAYDLGGWKGGGAIVVRSGRTGARVWAYPERWEDGSSRMSIAPLGDVDGDRVADFAIGMPDVSTSAKSAGRVVVLTGRSRATLFTIEGRVEEGHFGHVCALTDLDGDGRREFVVWGERAEGEQKSVGVCRGKDGALVGWLQSASGRALKPNGVTTTTDWNGDGVTDVIVGCRGCSRAAPDREEVHVFSGKDRSELLVVPEPSAWVDRADREEFGRSVVCLRGGSAPAEAQLVVAAYNAFPYGVLYAFRGRADGGMPELRVVGPTEFEIPAEIEALQEQLHIGGALTIAGDLDGDGVEDFLVSSTAYCASQRGVVWALSGTTGSTLFRWHRRAGVETPITQVGASTSSSK